MGELDLSRLLTAMDIYEMCRVALSVYILKYGEIVYLRRIFMFASQRSTDDLLGVDECFTVQYYRCSSDYYATTHLKDWLFILCIQMWSLSYFV